MNIGEILLGLLVGGGVGGGASYFLQKSRISEAVKRSEQKYLQSRQDLENAETELRDYKAQLSALNQSEAQAKSELKNLEVSYQSYLEEIERSYQAQLEQRSIESPDLKAELEQTYAKVSDAQNQALAYQAQILELQRAAAESVSIEPVVDETRLLEIEQHYQAQIEELKQTYATQLQEIESVHQAKQTEQQQAYSTQFQEIEQAYQNQIVELEKTHQIQIQELEQAYQSQMLELRQTQAQIEQPVSISSDHDEIRQPTQFTEPWDEDFSKNPIIEMHFAQIQDEKIAKVSSLEELADLTSENFPEPQAEETSEREQAEFFASQTFFRRS